MSDQYRATELEKAYFITITVVDWIDLFTRKRYKDMIVDALEHAQLNNGLEIYAWCLMPSHLHMICRSNSDHSVADIMRDMKGHTSKKLVRSIQQGEESRTEWLLERFAKACAHLKRDQQFKVWQNGYHAKELTSSAFIDQKLQYLHMNPVEAGIVAKPEDYVYGSGPVYAEKEGLLEVVVLPRIKDLIDLPDRAYNPHGAQIRASYSFLSARAGELNIQCSQLLRNVQIKDALGRTVISSDIYSEMIVLDLSRLSKGSYHIFATGADGTSYIEPLILQ